MHQLGENDSSAPKDSVNRGVRIEFLVELRSFFALWKWSTRDVLFKFVVPLTSGLRCRFSELPLFAGSGVVGRASIFISHCWGAPFGDMIAAVSEGRDGKEIVWLDILTVRQWPTTKNDLNFEVVIAACPLFVAVCPSLPEVVHSDTAITALPATVMAKIPFFRVWCLYETFYAAHFNKQIVVRGGCHQVDPATGKHRFVANTLMLEKMAATIDIAAAAATNPADRDMIFRKIEGFPGGLQGMNHKVRSVVYRAYVNYSDKAPICEAAIIKGDLKVLQNYCSAGGDLNIQNSINGNTLLMEAAVNVHYPV